MWGWFFFYFAASLCAELLLAGLGHMIFKTRFKLHIHFRFTQQPLFSLIYESSGLKCHARILVECRSLQYLGRSGMGNCVKRPGVSTEARVLFPCKQQDFAYPVGKQPHKG